MDLQTFWFCVVAFFWAGYLMLEGFDFGVGMLLPFLPRNETERGAMIKSIGPVWDGNEVWLVVAGAATFAAFPTWYGTMFSGFYLALLLILLLLMARVVSFEWRGKGDGDSWRTAWMWANAAGSLGIPLIWGIGLSNLLAGLPLAPDGGGYTGTFWDLFSPYTVVGGLAFVALFAFHGACYLTLRTDGDLRDRAHSAARRLAVPAVVLGAGYVVWTVVVAVDTNDKSALPPAVPGVAAIAAVLAAAVLAATGRDGLAFLCTAVGTVGVVATLFTSLYPRVMVSDPGFANSLTVSNASSAHYTLAVLTVIALIVLPIVLLYQAWTYYVFRARITGTAVGSQPEHQSR
jgi:cytochrome d ubiquinol oxidase subunit II